MGGRLVASSDEVSGTTTFAYDLADRQTAAGIVGRGGSSATYNAAGWILAQTDADGIVTKTTYDAAGRATALDVGGKVTTTSYDSAGRLESSADPDGRSVNYAYDDFSRKVREWHVVGGRTTRDVRTAYDALSRATETSETSGAFASSTVFNAVSSKPLSSTLTYADTTSTIAFDNARGIETSRSVTAGPISFSRTSVHDDQGRQTDWTITGLGSQHLTYDAEGKMTGQSGYGWSSAASYTYGDAGRKTAETLPLSVSATSWAGAYGYTPDGRLAQATIDGSTTTYAHDSAGNVTGSRPSSGSTTTLTYDAGNRLTSMGSTLFGWDSAHGWRTSMRRSGESSVTYTYSDGGRLTAYLDPSRDTSAIFSYDGQGQRDSSVVRQGSLITTTAYVYEGLSLLSLEASGSNGATYSLAYFYDEAGRPFSAVYSASDASPTLVHLVTTDRGDVVEILDSSGTAIVSYRYDAWGNPLYSWASDDSTVAATVRDRQPLRYAGYAYDTFSGLYYLSARYYDPATMQFISKDPAKADGEKSAYQYCLGNPVELVDPTGKYTKTSYYWAYETFWGSWFVAGTQYIDEALSGMDFLYKVTYRINGRFYAYYLGRTVYYYSSGRPYRTDTWLVQTYYETIFDIYIAVYLATGNNLRGIPHDIPTYGHRSTYTFWYGIQKPVVANSGWINYGVNLPPGSTRKLGTSYY